MSYIDGPSELKNSVVALIHQLLSPYAGFTWNKLIVEFTRHIKRL